MSPFRPGDKVRCISDETLLVKGAIYTVEKVSPKEGGIYLKETKGGWFFDRFELFSRLKPLKQHRMIRL